jgi:hypothetical protein
MRSANTPGGTLTCSPLRAHFVLWHLQRRLGKKAPAMTVSQLRTLLAVVLPFKHWTMEDRLKLLAATQRRHHRVALSHRKRRRQAVPARVTL